MPEKSEQVTEISGTKIASHRVSIPSTRVKIETYRDERKALLDQLDEQFPDFVHSYQHPDALKGDRDWEMQVKGQEFVSDAKTGKLLTHVYDPVVRQPRKDFEARQLAIAQDSIEQAKSAVYDPDDVKELKRAPREPRSSQTSRER